MRVELMVTIRGAARRVVWNDGQLVGDDEILRRLDRVGTSPVDRADLLSVVRSIELVTAQHVELANLDLVEPETIPRSRPPLAGSDR